MSPTQLSLRHMRKQGYTVAIAEHYNPWARRKIDLFNVFDLVAIRGDGEIIGVQTTSVSNISSRRKKILTSNEAHLWIKSGGGILLHGWKKPTKKVRTWTLKEERLLP